MVIGSMSTLSTCNRMWIGALIVLVLALMQSARGQEDQPCEDPLEAILATLTCIEEENPVCASAGYNSAEFKKLHNEVDTNTVIDQGGAFWIGTFALVDLSLDYNHMMNIGPNQASIRYVEFVNTTSGAEFGLPPSTQYPFGQSFRQHEHALVTVDNNCKITRWDQYGDNQEQFAVEDAVGALLSDPAIQCRFDPTSCTNDSDSPAVHSKTIKSAGRLATIWALIGALV